MRCGDPFAPAAGSVSETNRDGNRLEKSNGKLYWYGAGTEILDEMDNTGAFTNEYVFFGGKRVAMRDVHSGNIYYYAGDMLGSARTMVQAGQTWVCFDADFLPFGQEVDYTSTCGSNYKFEGKERDTETGNDDFGARYYRSALGRWLSPDWSAIPAPVPYANLTNPQTLNLYAMVSDNPETFADLDGHLTQDGPYNLETAEFSGTGQVPNCDYMGGDCSQKLFDDSGDEKFAILASFASYLSEVSSSVNGGKDLPYSAQQKKKPASGINPNFKLPTFSLANVCNSSACMHTFSAVSNFAAGAGDALTGRMIPGVHTSLTEIIRKHMHTDSVVSKNGAGYKVGEYTGSTVGWTLVGAFVGKYINNNPLVRIGRGHNPSGQRIWRIASGGRWGKGGPKLPWHWHWP